MNLGLMYRFAMQTGSGSLLLTAPSRQVGVVVGSSVDVLAAARAEDAR